MKYPYRFIIGGRTARFYKVKDYAMFLLQSAQRDKEKKNNDRQ